MKFLTDANIFPPIASYLRKAEHDVKTAQEAGLSNSSDDKIADLATREERTIITFDKHFGNIITYPPQDLFGIILIRIHPPLLNEIFNAIDNLFKNYQGDTFKGRLIVLSKTGYRIR